MALSKTLNLVDNFNETVIFTNAYIKVAVVSVNKNTCSFSYQYFKTKDGELLEGHSDVFDTDLDGTNAIKQAYLYLKTLPQFVDAEDC